MITSEPKVNLSASTKFRAGSLLAILALAGFSSTAADFTSAPLRVAGETNLHFTLLPSAQTGVTFSNFVSRATRSLHTLIPSGLAAGDVDGDGLCDLYFCSTDGANKLYRNLGNWRFEEITAPAGLEIKGQQQSVGATFQTATPESS